EWIGQDAARSGGFLRSPLRHETHRRGEGRPHQLPRGLVMTATIWTTCWGLALVGSIAFAQQRNFVACPIVRDTKTVPCFLAEYEGELYYLGIQQDITSEFHPPQLKHEVLVEGQVAEAPRVCGGIP